MWEKLKGLVPQLSALLGVLLVGVVIGWFIKPAKIEEKIKTVEVVKEVVVTQEKVRVEVVHVKDTQVVERWHREKTEETKPDGTKIAKEVEDKNIDSIVKEKENSTQVQIVTVEKQIVVEKEKIVERKPILPDWHMGVLIGVAPQFNVPTDTSLLVGLEAERRIIGPLFAGAWVMGGSPVIGGFKLTNASAGLKLGMDF